MHAKNCLSYSQKDYVNAFKERIYYGLTLRSQCELVLYEGQCAELAPTVNVSCN